MHITKHNKTLGNKQMRKEKHNKTIGNKQMIITKHETLGDTSDAHNQKTDLLP
jgi:hypothetical protein